MGNCVSFPLPLVFLLALSLNQYVHKQMIAHPSSHLGHPPLNEEAKRLLVLNLLQPILCLHIVNGVRYCSLSCKLLPLAQQWHIHVAGASCTAYKCPEKERALSFLPQRKMPLLRPFFKHHKAINKHSTGYVKPPDLKPTIPTKREHIP